MKLKSCTFLFVMLGVVILMGVDASVAFADEAASLGGGHVSGIFAPLAIAFGIGLAALGGTLGQSRAAVAALEGIARNPGAAGKMILPLLLGLALIESLVLLAWVLMFMVMGKI